MEFIFGLLVGHILTVNPINFDDVGIIFSDGNGTKITKEN